MMKKKIIWKITLFIGACPFIVPFLLGIYRMSIESWTWGDWLILYSFVYWPTYIVGLALVILSVMKLINQKMEIRKCEQRDIVLVGAFYDKVVAYLDQNINYPKWTYKEYPSEKSARDAVQKGHQYMCIDNGEIIGAFVLNDDPQGQYENATWSKSLKRGEYMVCHSLAADSSVKGKGVGTEMVLYCIEYAKKQGYQSIRLDVVPDNIPAKRLYEKCGFQYVGDVDLERNIAGIPVFSMYELNL